MNLDANKRYGVLFNTRVGSDYFYDAGTGKVISCSCEDVQLIKKILNGEVDVQTACELNREFGEFVREENLFKCPEEQAFLYPSLEEFHEIMESSCEQIIIELTDACNLRCKYCIYNEHHPQFRGFGNKNISFETAQKGINHILRNLKRDRIALTFYGGEPLINFETMKKCIDYTRSKYPRIKLDIGFTTNLTLLTKEMVDYFNTLDSVYILCSLDGPKGYHDENRINSKGEGSYDDAMRGLRLLLDGFDFINNSKKSISINCVVNPPYSKEKFEKISEHFYTKLGLPRSIKLRYAYLDRGNMEVNLNEKIISDDIEGKLEASPMEEWAMDSFIGSEEKDEFFSYISQDMLRVAKRIKSDEGLIESTYLHGNCIPGQRRIYLTVDGKFRTCERVGNILELGDIDKGYDFSRVYQKFFVDYADYFKNICKNCWGQSMCSVCYESTMDENGIKNKVEDTICSSSKRVILDALKNYYRAMEEEPDLVEEYINKYAKIQDEEESFQKYEI